MIALVLGALVALLVPGRVAADSKSGSYGHYVVSDSSGKQGATCNYTDGYPNHYLQYVTVRAPSVWWPNTSSASDDSGTIGWYAALQKLGGSGWVTVAKSSQQKATAHEDKPLHDSADKAPLSTRTITYAAGDADVQYRVKETIKWYNGDDSVRGTVSHAVKNYKLQWGSWRDSSVNSCAGRLTILT